MSERKVLRKTVTIYSDIKTNPTWSQAFPQVPFTPDEVIIRSVACNLAALSIYNIHSNLVNDTVCTVAGSANSGQIQALDTHFPLGYSVQGSYTFQARDATGNALAVNANDSQIYIQLEFVKYS